MAEMYTAAKLAEKLGVSAGQVKKVLAAARIEADEVKRGCKYYSEATLGKVKRLLEKS
jgi:hypothetical protein